MISSPRERNNERWNSRDSAPLITSVVLPPADRNAGECSDDTDLFRTDAVKARNDSLKALTREPYIPPVLETLVARLFDRSLSIS